MLMPKVPTVAECVPTEEDFKKVAVGLNMLRRGIILTNAALRYALDDMTLVKKDAEIADICRRFIAAVIMKWNALAKHLQMHLMSEYGYSIDDIRNMLAGIKLFTDRYSSACDKYALMPEDELDDLTRQATDIEMPLMPGAPKKQAASQSGGNIKFKLSGKTDQFYRIVAYRPDGIRRHILIGKNRNGVYDVVVAGSNITAGGHS